MIGMMMMIRAGEYFEFCSIRDRFSLSFFCVILFLIKHDDCFYPDQMMTRKIISCD